MSLRNLADKAGVSNPYLSQIERGLRKPSAEILKSIARGLSIRAETLYERAGLLDRYEDTIGVLAAIKTDAELNQGQKQALLQIYQSFISENHNRSRHDNGQESEG
jgi:transcriptional regulator with XRE-family HTH domain